MSYEPEPPPELSELEDRHQLQRHAASIGYVAVPEALWREIMVALESLITIGLDAEKGHALLRAGREAQEVIERERR